jgi:death-on-curing protein
MITYVELSDALEVIQKLGFFVKDVGLLDSALARPRTTVFGEDAYPSLPIKAAAMSHSIIKNHALVDGNKRTTWALMVAFLFLNDFKHNFTADEGYDWTMALATDAITIDEAARIIELHLVPLSS